MSAWTPEPWEVHPDDPHEFRNFNYGGIGHTWNEPAENVALMVESHANAARIVACVNALAGRDPAALGEFMEAAEGVGALAYQLQPGHPAVVAFREAYVAFRAES